MKKWYQSKLIWAGITAVLTAVLAALSTSWDWKIAVLGGLGALVVVLRKYTDTGIVALIFAAMIGTSACTGLNLPGDVSPNVIENVACNALYQSQCFGDVLTTIGIRHDTCSVDIQNMIDGKITLDASRIKDLSRVCRNDIRKIKEYIDKTKNKVPLLN
jgi:hypothetical protein